MERGLKFQSSEQFSRQERFYNLMRNMLNVGSIGAVVASLTTLVIGIEQAHETQNPGFVLGGAGFAAVDAVAGSQMRRMVNIIDDRSDLRPQSPTPGSKGLVRRIF